MVRGSRAANQSEAKEEREREGRGSGEERGTGREGRKEGKPKLAKEPTQNLSCIAFSFAFPFLFLFLVPSILLPLLLCSIFHSLSVR